jgi:NAD(P)-dependent dehydrogenase (short-subunit alcohol dehydrogenase family)
VLCREFAYAGAEVTIVAEVPEVHDVARELAALCGQPFGSKVCDISDRAAVHNLAEQVGQVDVLINNAALTVETPAMDYSETTARLFTRTLEINLTGLYWAAQLLSRGMADGGRIIFTSSYWGKTAGAGYSAYVASKHGIIGIVRTLAIELGARGISVNAICPHSIRTEKSLQAEPDVIRGATSNMVLHRGLIPPEDIAGLYLFLASPAGSEITGQAISVDRGAALF